MTIQTGMTAEELWRLPDDGHRTELVNGELIRMTPAGAVHGGVSFRFAGALAVYLRSHPIGVGCIADTGFILARNPDTVRAPDTAFVAKERLPGGKLPRGFAPFAPDLAVEVLSPDDRASEVNEKIEQYLEAGTRLVVVADPKRRSVTVHRPGGEARRLGPEDVLDGGDVLPGFSIRVAELFE